ncbi:Serine/threonine-protein phosphatase 7 long form like [Spatholobus suberectus]|nr:Serine/threonine-protein phosphatase 7 long form like [Spatholobus suberectus]
MDESTLSIMEVREDFMVSPNGESEPALRSAYFLKPLAKSLDGAVSEILSSSASMPLPATLEPKEWPLVAQVKALKIDNVRLALDSAMEHFRWRPYVQYAGFCKEYCVAKEKFKAT